jgi:hypothetical protein
VGKQQTCLGCSARLTASKGGCASDVETVDKGEDPKIYDIGQDVENTFLYFSFWMWTLNLGNQ